MTCKIGEWPIEVRAAAGKFLCPITADCVLKTPILLGTDQRDGMPCVLVFAGGKDGLSSRALYMPAHAKNRSWHHEFGHLLLYHLMPDALNLPSDLHEVFAMAWEMIVYGDTRCPYKMVSSDQFKAWQKARAFMAYLPHMDINVRGPFDETRKANLVAELYELIRYDWDKGFEYKGYQPSPKS